MARPKSNTVDYFPHDADSSGGKTLTVIQSKYGNDGYSFWWRTLELLCKSEGHYYDCRDKSNWDFLLARTHVVDVSATEILAELALLGAIDADLWKIKVIWCQNLVNRLQEVYRKRKRELPQKPVLSNINHATPDVSATEILAELTVSATENRQYATENTQSKVKETKGKERKGNTTTTGENVFNIYESNIGLLTPLIVDKLKFIDDTYPIEWFQEAMTEACEHNVRNLRYIETILERWASDGFKVNKSNGKIAENRVIEGLTIDEG